MDSFRLAHVKWHWQNIPRSYLCRTDRLVHAGAQPEQAQASFMAFRGTFVCTLGKELKAAKSRHCLSPHS